MTEYLEYYIPKNVYDIYEEMLNKAGKEFEH